MKIIKKLMMIAPLMLSFTPMAPISSCTSTNLKKIANISKSAEEYSNDSIVIHEQTQCLSTLEVLNEQELSGLAVGNKTKIQLKGCHDDAKNFNLEYESSNPDVASVEDGYVVPKNVGHTEIRIRANTKCPEHRRSTFFYVNVYTEGCKVSFYPCEYGQMTKTSVIAQVGSSLSEIIHNYDISCIPNDGFKLQGWFDENNKPVNFDDPITCDKNFFIKFKTLEFETDSWQNIAKFAVRGLDKLKEIYQVDTFVGLTKTIRINGYPHEVKVIGENHDTISGTDIKAPLTFQLTTLISDLNGNALETCWNKLNNFKYTRGYLKGNLMGDGWMRSWETTAWDLLDRNLTKWIKKVDKCAWEAENTDLKSGHLEYYSSYLFALTCTEYAYADEDCAVEGTPYEYWANHQPGSSLCDKCHERALKDANGNEREYWLASTDTDWSYITEGFINEYRGDAWCMDNNKIKHDWVHKNKAVTFGFCI